MQNGHASAAIRSSTSKSWLRSSRLFFLFLALGSLLLSSCSILDSDKEEHGSVLIDSVRRIIPPERERVQRKVRIDDLKRAQGNMDISKVRAVKLVLSASPTGEENTPQYRLFDIRPGSVGELLGLQNADILVAANGYVVFHADQFAAYLYSIPAPGGTFIEIRRDGKPMLLEYNFVDSKGQTIVMPQAEDQKPATDIRQTSPATPAPLETGEDTGNDDETLPILNTPAGQKTSAAQEKQAPRKSVQTPTPAPGAKATAVPGKKEVKQASKKAKKTPAPASKKKKKRVE